jgi:hypothetical protein
MPFFVTVLLADLKGLPNDENSLRLSPARLPLVTILGIYFCNLVVEFLSTERDAACDIIDENIKILPRLTINNCLKNEEAKEYHTLMERFRKWARVCVEPMSIGQISLVVRIYICGRQGTERGVNSQQRDVV